MQQPPADPQTPATTGTPGIDAIMARVFHPDRRYPRSDEYKRGARAEIVARVTKDVIEPLPYPLGSAQADAYLAGSMEGVNLPESFLNGSPA
jgi:uncharacterized protein with NRDE domain